MKKESNVLPIFSLIAFVVILILLGILWGYKNNLSVNAPILFDAFDSYGSFVGGVLGTLLAAGAVYFAWKTFRSDRDEAEKERIKSYFYELINRHLDNKNSILEQGRTIFQDYITLFSDIYKVVCNNIQQDLPDEEHKKNICKLSYLYFFYGTSLDKETIRAAEVNTISDRDIDNINGYFTSNAITLEGTSLYLGIYFRQLYHIVTYIDKQTKLDYKEKYNYIKSLRVCLNLDEQYLLFLNSLSSFGSVWELKYTDISNPDYNKGLITKYNLIKNLPKAYAIKLNEWDFRGEYLYSKVLYEDSSSPEKEQQRRDWVRECNYK